MNYNLDNEKERGWILRILDRTYPDPLDQDTLKKQLIDLKFLTSEMDIRGNIAYLKGRGLISTDTVGVGSLNRTVVMLTPDGKDLVDGLRAPFPGVDL